MLTLKKTLAEQNNLHHLCADRNIKTNEIFAPNACYGYDFIFKKYTGLPQNYPLKIVVPHSVNAGSSGVWEVELQTSLPMIFVYSREQEELYRQADQKLGSQNKIVLSASPLLYLLELLKEQPKPERKGTIFFPAHSTQHITVQMDFDALAEELLKLDEEYQPVTVCIYWSDFNYGHHIPFQKRGIQVVSAGHVYDPLFLFRLYHLCSMHQYSSSNSIGSHLFYSIKFGCSYFHFETIDYSLLFDELSTQNKDKELVSKTHEARKQHTLLSRFKTPSPFMTKEQLKIVDEYLGTDSFKSPQQVRQQILYAEMLYRINGILYNRSETIGMRMLKQALSWSLKLRTRDQQEIG